MLRLCDATDSEEREFNLQGASCGASESNGDLVDVPPLRVAWSRRKWARVRMDFYNVEKSVELASLRTAEVPNLEQFEAALAGELCENAGSLPLSHCCSTGGEYVSGTAEVVSIEARLRLPKGAAMPFSPSSTRFAGVDLGTGQFLGAPKEFPTPFLILKHPFPTPEKLGEDFRDDLAAEMRPEHWPQVHKESIFVVNAESVEELLLAKHLDFFRTAKDVEAEERES
jgi:hypothetical protein